MAKRGRRTEPVSIEWMLSHTKPAGECLEWQRALNTDGYPRLAVDGDFNVKGHRLMYSLCNPGEDIEGRVIRHTCDNTKCINPEHLLSGTAYENTLDRDLRGRMRRTLSDDQVRDIRDLYFEGWQTKSELSRLYNISLSNVVALVSYRTFKHVPDNLEED